MSINYDDPAMQVTESAFVNWDEIGAGGSVAGTITDAVTGTDFNGAPCPQYEIEDAEGETRTLTCGQADLKKQMLVLRPQVGDRIKVTFTHIKPTASGFKKKFFAIEHSKGGAPAAQAPASFPKGDDEPPF